MSEISNRLSESILQKIVQNAYSETGELRKIHNHRDSVMEVKIMVEASDNC